MVDYRALVGTKWEYGQTDCYTLVRAYFRLQGVELPDFERPADLDACKESIFLREAERLGFVEVPFTERRVGDVLIIRLFSRVAMHAAVLVEPDRILHQMPNARSGVEDLRSYYVRSIAAVFRYAAGLSAG